ncbi:MAG: ABC transporter ATP-binding protein/permease [Acidimicrobiia bacterium]|nr:ABC transporter ATP-binding protein/permease [Acidimicrobiia bacterium]
MTDTATATEPDLETAGAPFSWRRVGDLFRPHRTQVLGVLGLVVLTSGLGIVNPLLIQRVFDDGLFPTGADGPDVATLLTLTSIMLAVAAAGGAFGVWQTLVTNRLGQRVLRELRDRLYAHLQRLSLSFYSTARTGDLQSRITSDVGGVQTTVTTTLSSILSNLVTFASAIVAMSLLSWQLTLLAVATVPFFVIATRRVGQRREALTGETQAATARMSVITQETLSVSGITLAKLFGQQDREIERFEDSNRALADVATRQQVIGQSFFTVVQTFLGVSPVLIYLAAGILLDRGVSDISAGTIVAITTLQSRLFFPVARLLETFVELQSSRAMFRRIFRYLDEEPDVVDRPAPRELDRSTARGEVTFDSVGFTYVALEGEHAAPAALDDISFRAGPGELVAFVGPSGAGKSTVLNLVARLYDPTTGTISLDGIDLRDLSLASLADTVGFVTQESYLFADTLGANIAYGHPDASPAEIEKAARAAAIHDRIMDFEGGYETMVGERGFRLSGGERQRIAIARVLLHDPRVLVLDEATSALDTASERRIQEALGELIGGRTTLAVAHRLSTIQAADTIHVIDNGRIVESGSHDELLELGGAYRGLYHEQFADGAVETRCADGVVLHDGQCVPERSGPRILTRSGR